MKLFLLLILNFTFASLAHAQGVCIATEIGYGSYCAAQPNQSACDSQSQCAWANAGYGACSATETAYEVFCAAQPNQSACNFQDQCFWANQPL